MRLRRLIRKSSLLTMIIVTLLIMSNISFSETVSSENELSSFIRTNQLQYTAHDAIVISSDSDFETQGWPGNGTRESPYTIQGLSIITSKTCINIFNVAVFFLINGCQLSGGSIDYDYGILLDNAPNGRIESCSISDKYEGIYVVSSDKTVIRSSIIYNSKATGIYIWKSEDCVVEDCTIIDNGWNGINLFWLNNCTVLECTIYQNLWTGIHLQETHDCQIIRNTISDMQETGAIGLYSDDSCNITGNTLENCGIVIIVAVEQLGHPTIENNTVNGLPIKFYYHLNDITLNASLVGQVIIFNSHNVTLQGGLFSGVTRGIQIFFSSNVSIENCTAVYNNLTGIFGFESEFSSITNSTFAHNVKGIFLWRCRFFTVSQNTLGFSLSTGISLSQSIDCTISENEVSDNDIFGISLIRSNNNTIFDNTITRGEWQGIYLAESVDNRILGNSIISNSYYGIWITGGSTNNIFYDNRLQGNSVDNAVDDGESNYWDDGINSGNYWDDYSGNGYYRISGQANSSDRFPLGINDIRNTTPSINRPLDIVYHFGDTNVSLTWTPSAISPASYVLYLNSTLIASGPWNGTELSFAVDGNPPGVYNYTLVVFEMGGEYAFDSAIVIVVGDTNPTLPDVYIDLDTPLLVLTFWSCVITAEVLIVIFILRKKSVKME